MGLDSLSTPTVTAFMNIWCFFPVCSEKSLSPSRPPLIGTYFSVPVSLQIENSTELLFLILILTYWNILLWAAGFRGVLAAAVEHGGGLSAEAGSARLAYSSLDTDGASPETQDTGRRVPCHRSRGWPSSCAPPAQGNVAVHDFLPPHHLTPSLFSFSFWFLLYKETFANILFVDLFAERGGLSSEQAKCGLGC